MEHHDAVSLIKKGVVKTTSARWADLGAGTGVFTKALAELLEGVNATIYAVDKEKLPLERIGLSGGDTTIIKEQMDFVKDEFPFHDLDGVLLANAIHFVQDQQTFIDRLKKILKPGASILVIEYDTLESNRWVPYPVNFSTLQRLAREAGFPGVVRLAEHPSIYHKASIYSALISC